MILLTIQVTQARVILITQEKAEAQVKEIIPAKEQAPAKAQAQEKGRITRLRAPVKAQEPVRAAAMYNLQIIAKLAT